MGAAGSRHPGTAIECCAKGLAYGCGCSTACSNHSCNKAALAGCSQAWPDHIDISVSYTGLHWPAYMFCSCCVCADCPAGTGCAGPTHCMLLLKQLRPQHSPIFLNLSDLTSGRFRTAELASASAAASMPWPSLLFTDRDPAATVLASAGCGTSAGWPAPKETCAASWLRLPLSGCLCCCPAAADISLPSTPVWHAARTVTMAQTSNPEPFIVFVSRRSCVWRTKYELSSYCFCWRGTADRNSVALRAKRDG